ncbi:MAG: glycosyltransferase family 4 protein [Acutalibacteraceae bacterium]
MKTVFLSNYYTHHQKPFCEKMYELIGSDFAFVSTSDFSDERKMMGWNDESAPFVFRLSEDNKSEIKSLVYKADVVIIGSAPWELVEDRLKAGKTVFRYSERIFKNGYEITKWLPRVLLYRRNFGKYKSLYLLSAGAYTTVDYAMHGVYLNKSYKWGYFTQTKKYDTDKLFESKDTKNILWCGRFLDWKHPDEAVNLAKRLKSAGYDFNLTIIGTGELKNQLIKAIDEYDLSDCVELLNAMPPEKIRIYMEKAGIYLFTSDFREGWGAVLNESMNSGCAVVANHAIGSVPYLLKNGENGFIYKNGDGDAMFDKVKFLLDNPDKQKETGLRAYRTIVDCWNPETAAERFISFSQNILEKGRCDLFDDGPCSKAPIIKNKWFSE